MILKSQEFILRRPKASDLNSWHKNMNDKTIGKNLRAVIYPVKKEVVKKYLEEALKNIKLKNKDKEIFVIDINGECAGTIALSNIELNHKAIVGYWLGKKFRGRGIMSKALKMITEYGFRKYHLRRIKAHVVTFNKASARVLEKCGYKLEGIQKKNRLKNGKYYDDYLYAITR
jgi:[ribosomal protein S5]-alanine N-acetyltransferase